MRTYYCFSRKHFEYEMRNFLIKERLGYFTDITEEYIEEGNNTWERMYKVTTRNPSVDIVIFSSLDIRTNKMRGNSKDAVRLVMRWKTKNGHVYKRISRHDRIRSLFKNIEKSISKTQSTIFNLNYGEFTKAS